MLGLLTAIGPLSIDTYLPSLPAIAIELRASASLVEQSVSAYFFGLAVGLIASGPLSDRFGRRPPLFVGLGIYLLATLACVFASSIDILVGARAVQGLGASATVITGRAVIRDVWSGNQAARAMSFVMIVTAFTPMIAPLIGGQIFAYLGWRAIFWLMFGFGALLIVLVLLRLPETNDSERRGDVPIFAFFRAYGHVLRSWRAWSYLLCGGLIYAALFAYITGSPFVYIELFGVDPEYFGLFFALNSLGVILGNGLNSRLVTRVGYVRPLGGGAAISLIGALALLVCAVTATGGFIAVVSTLFIAVAPVGMVGANAIAGLFDLYPRNAGAASALFGVSQFGLGALAGVLVGTFSSGTPVAMALAMTIMAGGAVIAWLPLSCSRSHGLIQAK